MLNGQVNAKFMLKESPMLEQFANSLSQPPRISLVENQAVALYTFISKLGVLMIALGLVFAIVRVAVDSQRQFSAFGDLVIYQAYIALSLLLMFNYPFLLAMRAFGTAKVLVVFDRLQQSTAPFDDVAGVDEFDEEASAPIKDVEVSTGDIFKKSWSVLTRREPILTSSLLSSLSSINVVSYVDREASLTTVSFCHRHS